MHVVLSAVYRVEEVAINIIYYLLLNKMKAYSAYCRNKSKCRILIRLDHFTVPHSKAKRRLKGEQASLIYLSSFREVWTTVMKKLIRYQTALVHVR